MKIQWPILLAICGLFTVVGSAFAQTWTLTSAPSNYWFSVACSADGNKLVVAAYGPIYTSTNSGMTWTQTGAPTNEDWSAVASSADGNKLVAAALSGVVYTSTNSGDAWTSNDVPSEYWSAVASSADGNRLVAVAPFDSFQDYNSPSVIFTSTNAGMNWTQQTNGIQQTNALGFGWYSVASSADGTKLAVVGNWSLSHSPIYISTDSGITWEQTGTPPGIWQTVAPQQVISSSADGTRLIVAFPGDSRGGALPIYISTNSGATWAQTSAPSNNWSSVASSADGSRLAAACRTQFSLPGSIYTSTNSGVTWTSNNVSDLWMSVALSADGNKMVAATSYERPGPIYTSQSVQQPSVNLKPSDGNLTASWIVPSTKFLLQQSLDLFSWTDVTDTPTLNLTNLQEELVLSPTNSTCFYRLKTP